MSDTTEQKHTEEPTAIPAHPFEQKYMDLATAAQNVIDLYRATHTVVNYEDYRYPGLEQLAKVLDGVS